MPARVRATKRQGCEHRFPPHPDPLPIKGEGTCTRSSNLTAIATALPGLASGPLDFGRTRAIHARPVARAPADVKTDLASVIERAKAGESSAFRELYSTYRRQVASQLAFL